MGLVVVLVIILVVSRCLAVLIVAVVLSVLASLTTVILIILVVLATIVLRRGLLLPRDGDGDGIIHLVVRIWLDEDIFHIRRLLGT